MSNNSPSTPWWLNALSADQLTQASQGLSEPEATARLKRSGQNRFDQQHRSSLWVQYLRRFKNPLIVILLVASAISAMTGEMTSFVLISCMVILSVTLDFVQEYRANSAAEKLRDSVALRATVLRNNQPCDMAAVNIVVGDVVLLSAGDLVPADARILEAQDFFVKQAMLTGEPYPIEKHAITPPASATELAEASNAVFMGTSVVSGTARVWVQQTGSATAMGAIAHSLNKQTAPTSFESGTHRFGLLIMRLTVLLVLFVLLINLAFDRPWLESFLFAVALAVGLTPELLPMVVSVTLSHGALRLASQHVIVKRLSAIQDLGSMDVFCTDKTGTLTEASIRLERHVNTLGQTSQQVLNLAYLNCFFQTGMKNPMDEAVLIEQGVSTMGWQKLDEVPFDFERRRVSVLLRKDNETWLIVKGAPEEVVSLCTQFETQQSAQELSIAERQRIHAQFQALEKDGLRALAVAYKRMAHDAHHMTLQDEAQLTLVGFAAFLDPPKASAALALTKLSKLGVAIKVVTGDSEWVTQHVCQQLQLPVTGVLTGKEISLMDDLALGAVVESNNLFCRVNPAQKERVIHALRARGHVVGYLGDGINDAPSLHACDVGLSVDTAADVAKEAADMILLKQDLRVLITGVLEGRRTFSNIMKYIMMGTSSNFGNMFSMAGASLFLPFLPMLPTQILLNNILYDLSEIPIPLDKVDGVGMRRPQVLDLNFIRNFMWVIGPIRSALDFLSFYVMLKVLNAQEALFQTGWFVESLCTQVLVIFIIRTRGNPLKSRAHPLLTVTSLSVVAIAIALPLSPWGSYFGFVAPPLKFYLILGGMVMCYLVLVEIAKQGFYKWQLKAQKPK